MTKKITNKVCRSKKNKEFRKNQLLNTKILPIICFSIISFIFAPLQATNLTANGDFAELDKEGFPSQWTQVSKGGARATQTAGIDGENTPVMMFELNGELTRIEQRHLLLPDRQYRVRFSAKSENLSSAGVYLTTMKWQGGGSVQLKGTTEWKEYDFVTSFSGEDKYYRLILFAKKGASGKVYFKNISVTEVVKSDAPKALLSIAKFSQPPVIDGKLDDAIWSHSLAVTPFVKLIDDQFTQFAIEKTTARLGYDEKNLYVGFHCEQQCLDPVRNTLDKFKATQKTPDSDLFKDDCVILFTQSTIENAPAYEFIVNALGTLTDSKLTPPDIWSNRSLDFSSNAKVAAYVGDGFYSVEMSIPLASIGLSGKDQEHCKVLLGRLNQESRERSVYYPAKAGFHQIEALGDAKFNAKTPGMKEFRIGELSNGSNDAQLNFTSEATITIDTNSEQQNKVSVKTKSSESGFVKLGYNFPGIEYNYLQFEINASKRLAWRSPEYIISSAVKKINVHTTGVPSSPTLTMRKTDNGYYCTSTVAGLYHVDGLTPSFALSEGDDPEFITFNTVPDMLAVDFTKFWPEDNNTFHIAENSIQPLHIVLNTQLKELTDLSYTINIVLPTEFNLLGATATRTSGYIAKTGKASNIKICGIDYKVFPIKMNKPLPVKAAPSESDALTLLVELPTSGNKFINRQAKFYYFAKFDSTDVNILEVPGKLDVTIYPALANKVPEKFKVEMWGGRMVNLRDKALMNSFIKKTVQGSGFNQLQNLPIEGMRRMGVLNYKRAWGEEANKYVKIHPEARRIGRNGEPVPCSDYNILCPIAMMNDPIKLTVENKIKQGFKNYDIINYDYESPAENGRISCYCDRCRKSFANFAKLAKTPDADKIIQNHKDQWIDFMTSQLANTCKFFMDIAHSFNKELSFYSGYQSEKTLIHYTVDWNKLGGKIDTGSAGYRTTAAVIRTTIDALNGTPLLTGVITSPWLLNSREKNSQIPLSDVLVGIVAGSKGILCYNLPGLNGKSYYSISQVTSLLTDYENIIFDGRRHQKGAKVSGIPNDAWIIFELDGSKEKVLIAYNNTENPVDINISFDQQIEAFEYFYGGSFSKKSIRSTIKPFDAQAYIIK